tara:strand:- start:1779 stop:2504 length:726 start_codon:yes stop_codon:yes gene_type:complete
MQISDDGNFMWNGTEWIPNPDAANVTPEHKEVDEVPMVESVPAAVTPEPMASQEPVAMTQSPMAMEPMTTMPGAIVVGPIQGAPTGASAINMAAALSVFKYGILSILGMFLSVIILGIVWGGALAFADAGDDGGGVIALISMFGAILITVIGYGQMIIYPVGVALKDGRSDSVSFGYVDSWKTSIAGFIESVGVTAGMALIIGIGVYIESIELIGVGGFAFGIFLVGYVPYMVRKAAEIMN